MKSGPERTTIPGVCDVCKALTEVAYVGLSTWACVECLTAMAEDAEGEWICQRKQH